MPNISTLLAISYELYLIYTYSIALSCFAVGFSKGFLYLQREIFLEKHMSHFHWMAKGIFFVIRILMDILMDIK